MKIVCSILFIISIGYAQVPDSLYQKLQKASNTIEKAQAYSELGGSLLRNENDSAKYYLDKATKLFKTEKLQAEVLRNKIRVGLYHISKDEIVKAENLLLEALDEAKALKSPEMVVEITSALNEEIYQTHNQFDKAFKLAFSCKQIAIDSKDSSAIFKANQVLYAVYFFAKSDYNKQMQIANENVAIAERMQDMDLLETAYFNKAIALARDGKNAEAKALYRKIMGLEGRMEDKSLLSRLMNNLGSLYTRTRDLDSARICYELAYKFSEEIERLEGMAAAKLNLGNLYGIEGDFETAKNNCFEALQIFREAGITRRQDACLSCLYEANKLLGNYEEALNWYEQSFVMKDSFMSAGTDQSIRRLENEFALKKTHIADSIRLLEANKLSLAEIKARDAEIEQKALEQERDSYIRYGLIVLAVLIGFIGVYMFRKFKTSQAQKKIISESHEQLEIKNKEILDSIQYAQRIQTAILPPTKFVKEHLPQSFILYKPKDIVAGDFYWMELAESKTGNNEKLCLFAAADCTGHGVPGAMVSVICNNGLNRSVREHGLTDPGKILDHTREIVISEFKKSEEVGEVKDGMDVALCSLSGVEGESARTLKYAGAHNPLWIIRKGANEVEEVKADKQPIGRYTDPIPYTTHTFTLHSGDSFYIFSDGFVDQFGGDKGKKFKAANFKQLLLSIQDERMEAQQTILSEAFEKWKGDLEQLDDVCVIGVKI
jgi:serine phosphatase RsbU (regulator of sigma subunit)